MTSPALPIVHVSNDAREALSRRALATLASDSLAAFLAQRRWYGAKGGAPSEVRVASVIPLPAPVERAAIAVLEVELADATLRYQLPLAVRPRDAFGGGLPAAVLAEVSIGGRSELLVDATEDASFRSQLGRLLREGTHVRSDDGEWIAEPVSGAIQWNATPSRVGSAEQSNTSIIYGDRAILKLFRRLESGESPDVEISRFLTTRTTFRNTPALLGVIRIVREDTSTVSGMLSEFLPGSGDAWAHAVERVRAYLRAGGSGTPANPFAAEMRELGRATRALHEALASHPDDPAFPARPVSNEDFDAWADTTRRTIARGLDLLDAQLRAHRLSGPTLAIAEATLGRREGAMRRVVEVLADARSARDPGRLTRHHGDYHLGQVLRAADGRWMIIDFEGEPSRPLEERRAPHSPLRDVAGLMRSFAYAAATAAMELGGVGRDPSLETRAARWERDARASFLEGYLEAPATATTPVPIADREYVAGVVTLFEIEKVFYELAYELNNRPDWVWIPLRGIAKLF